MILFLHLHKTGGTSLRYMLSRAIPQAQIYPVPALGSYDDSPPYPTQETTPRQLQESLSEGLFKGYTLVMGHFDWNVVSALPEDTVILTLLRDPVEQLYSQIRWFEQDRKNYGFVADVYRNTGLEGFLHSPYAEKYLNQQTRFLTGRMWSPGELSSGVLTYGKRNLGRCVYGLLERFEESLALFGQATGLAFDELRHENRNPGRKRPLTEAQRERIADMQSYDMSLYAYAVEHFEEQFNGDHTH